MSPNSTTDKLKLESKKKLALQVESLFCAQAQKQKIEQCWNDVPINSIVGLTFSLFLVFIVHKKVYNKIFRCEQFNEY